MKLETILKILLQKEILSTYKSDLFNAYSESLSELFEFSYGPQGSCEQLTLESESIKLPYTKMGTLDSTKLFGIDELTLFAFYALVKGEVSRSLDIGANIGLHSIIMGKLGYKVIGFEPDPVTYQSYESNIKANNADNHVNALNTALSDKDGSQKFTRVCGNTMSSHISGSKSNPYGELEFFDVETLEANKYFSQADLVKLDAESHEFPILNNALRCANQKPEIFMEVGEDTDSNKLFELLKDNGYYLAAQQKGWREIISSNEIPKTHHQGTMVCSQGLIKSHIDTLLR